jgi:SAM-dependent methyltransferase
MNRLQPASVAREYWRDPWDAGNQPQVYLDEDPAGSRLLVQTAGECVARDASILEIGCNVGRNLEHLRRAGYTDLHAIEMNAHAVALMRTSFPELKPTLHQAQVERVIEALPTNGYELVFTMAVLLHIHPSSDWILPHVARITSRFLLTIEVERPIRSWRKFPRDYGAVFGDLGFDEVESRALDESFGVLGGYTLRLFSRVNE